uniref:Nonstructural protein n=1 Tax=Emberiza tristrami ambidensovirus TaxID=2794447 RepID=A0A8A4XEN1_9VIRU|nr:MAG: nonstructural protein [Emberiza tristrami ambidensovirus]
MDVGESSGTQPNEGEGLGEVGPLDAAAAEVSRKEQRFRACVNARYEEIGTGLAEELQKMATLMYERLSRSDFYKRRYYFHDVITIGSADTLAGTTKRLVNIARDIGGGLFGVSSHSQPGHDHVHVYHDCAYSNRQCRCAWRQEFKTKDETKSRVTKLPRDHRFCQRDTFSEKEKIDFEKILLYFYAGAGRKAECLFVDRRMRTVSSRNEDMVDGESSGDRSGREYLSELGMEGCDEVCEAERREDSVASNQPIERFNRRTIRQIQKSRRSGFQRVREEAVQQKYETIEFMINTYPCSPITALPDSREWLEHGLKYVRADDAVFKDVVDSFQKKICYWSLSDFNEFYSSNRCFPNFAAGYMPVSLKYLSMMESFEIVNKLLHFQFNNDEDNVKLFLRSFYDIIERKIPKRNCLLICGPSQSGKSFFMDIFTSYLMNFGQFGRACNRYNQFCFQDGYGKRIIIWDEPSYEGSAIEDMKKILGGGDATVRVKFKPDMPLYRTPIIILTNNRISIMDNPHFAQRIIKYEWRPCDLLEHVDRLPNPLIAYKLFEHYNIIE